MTRLGTLVLGLLLCAGVVSAETASLRETAQQAGLTYGCAVTASKLANDGAFAAAVAQHCAIIVPEVGLKMTDIAVAPDVYDFRSGDWLVAFAETSQQQVHGHTLVWYKRVPAWLSRRTHAEVRQFLQTYITTVVEHYPQIQSWDVVNEPLGRSFWQRGMGESYIDLAFHTAHAANPSAQLVLNEWGLESSSSRRSAFLALVKRLKARGVPLHAVGLESHLSGAVASSSFTKFCAQLQALGLTVLVTELDVNSSNDQRVADTYSIWRSHQDLD